MNLLVTAFNAFGSESLNAAQLVLQRLPRSLPSGAAQLHTLLVPTEFAACAPLVERNILRLQPDAVLLLGQAAGRRGLTPERIAINLDDARIPDNAGLQPTDRPIVPEGPAAYFSTLPVKAITAAIQAQGVPASVSNSAGTFVCNHLMYCVLHFLRDRPQIRASFLHLPPTPLQAAALQVASPAPLPSLSTEDSLRGVLAALQVIADTQTNRHLSLTLCSRSSNRLPQDLHGRLLPPQI